MIKWEASNSQLVVSEHEVTKSKRIFFGILGEKSTELSIPNG